MINPLELRVALNAVPEMGIQAHRETAGALYRQVQDMGQALQETRARPEQVSEINPSASGFFYGVENPGDGSARREETRERLRDRHRELIESWDIYGPGPGVEGNDMARAFRSEGAGMLFDFRI